jgi:type IV secretion system protein VirB8
MISDKTSDKTPFSKAISFEVSLMQKVRKSERVAWIVAGCSLFLSLVLACGYMLIMPLKERVPYLVVVDPTTGTSALSKIVGSYNVEEITKNEALAKSNVAHFLTARESYDFDLIGRADWLTVHAMAGTDAARGVLKSYKDLYDNRNPDNLGSLYGPKKSVRVKIKSIVLTPALEKNQGDQEDKNYVHATIRFDRFVVNKELDRIESINSNTASITFGYANLEMPDEAMRIQNPLGFVVTAYRVDPEVTSTKLNMLKEGISLP